MRGFLGCLVWRLRGRGDKEDRARRREVHKQKEHCRGALVVWRQVNLLVLGG